MKSLISLVVLLSILAAPANPLTDEVDRLFERSLPLVSTEKLAKELLLKNRPLLLATRGQQEWKVSHLPGAIWVGYDSFELKNLPQIDKKAAIVVYCSIGFRSEKIGGKLQAAGYTNVRNLYGGIFTWANESREMVDLEKNPTSKIHGYSKKWARFLEPEVPIILTEP